MDHPLNCFARIQIVNLVERTDRRREMISELARIGLQPAAGRLEFFEARRPLEIDDWPSLGARGCFASHYQILRRARDEGLRNILVLEDDCQFTPAFLEYSNSLTQRLTEADGAWDLLYIGHREPVPFPEHEPLSFLSWKGHIGATHAYAVDGAMLPRLVEFLALVMSRPNGHPAGGRQHYDGALNTFRMQNTDVRTLLSAPSLATQRSSRSDIAGNQWFDRVRGIRSAAGALRKVRRWIRP